METSCRRVVPSHVHVTRLSSGRKKHTKVKKKKKKTTKTTELICAADAGRKAHPESVAALGLKAERPRGAEAWHCGRSQLPTPAVTPRFTSSIFFTLSRDGPEERPKDPCLHR